MGKAGKLRKKRRLERDQESVFGSAAAATAEGLGLQRSLCVCVRARVCVCVVVVVVVGGLGWQKAFGRLCERVVLPSRTFYRFRLFASCRR